MLVEVIPLFTCYYVLVSIRIEGAYSIFNGFITIKDVLR